MKQGVQFRQTTGLVRLGVTARNAAQQLVVELSRQDFDVVDNAIPQAIAAGAPVYAIGIELNRQANRDSAGSV